MNARSGVIERDARGTIWNVSAPLTNEAIHHIDIDHYIGLFKQYQKNKDVYLVEAKYALYWCEDESSKWFCGMHKKLGYTDLVQERTPRYKELKEELGFYGRPDYLVKEKGTWKKIEIECWVHKYLKTHPEGYADVVVAYDSYREEPDNIKIITMKEYYGVKDIISVSEFSEFMYLYNPDYKREYDGLLSKTLKM